jgi:hypothetical protein
VDVPVRRAVAGAALAGAVAVLVSAVGTWWYARQLHPELDGAGLLQVVAFVPVPALLVAGGVLVLRRSQLGIAVLWALAVSFLASALHLLMSLPAVVAADSAEEMVLAGGAVLATVGGLAPAVLAVRLVDWPQWSWRQPVDPAYVMASLVYLSGFVFVTVSYGFALPGEAGGAIFAPNTWLELRWMVEGPFAVVGPLLFGGLLVAIARLPRGLAGAALLAVALPDAIGQAVEFSLAGRTTNDVVTVVGWLSLAGATGLVLRGLAWLRSTTLARREEASRPSTN